MILHLFNTKLLFFLAPTLCQVLSQLLRIQLCKVEMIQSCREKSWGLVAPCVEERQGTPEAQSAGGRCCPQTQLLMGLGSPPSSCLLLPSCKVARCWQLVLWGFLAGLVLSPFPDRLGPTCCLSVFPLMSLLSCLFRKKVENGVFPGSSMVKTLHLQCRDCEFGPRWGN